MKFKMNNPFGKDDYVDGLYVKNGRLMNDRRDGETGIARMARIKRAIKNDRKINRIAEGISQLKIKRTGTNFGSKDFPFVLL